jgi:hypothetical protein
MSAESILFLAIGWGTILAMTFWSVPKLLRKSKSQ